jgi:peptidoglycan/xylan/chitin deacetylase (PgdA/CDA1 family)
VRIPVTICHGTSWRPEPKRLDAARFALYFRIAAEYGFRSVTYDRLRAWRAAGAAPPGRPVLFDFDHPMRSVHRVIWPLMARHGFVGTLFVNTSWMEKAGDDRYLTWDEIGELVGAGWRIGAHLHQHYNLAYLARRDPSGGLIREQMAWGDRVLAKRLGVVPEVFAYTGTTFSLLAEAEAKRRYSWARLWITGADYQTDRGPVRFADLAGIAGPDEDDGGPPFAARYITERTDPYRLPAMELQGLIYEEPAFRRYLEGALATQ